MLQSSHLESIARKHGIILLLQFGSSVSGRLHPGSDTDLAVLLERLPQTFQEYGELTHDLQTLFPEREVDLVVINRADPLLLKKITESCRLLHGSARQLSELKIYAYKRYQDHRPFLALERQYVDRMLEVLGRR